jgi:hypothetical protein
MQISEILPHTISINYVEVFVGYMNNLIYSLMQISLYCGSISLKIENTRQFLTEVLHI